MVRDGERDPVPEEPGDAEDARFDPAELGPDSGVYFIEQLLRPDPAAAARDAAAESALPAVEMDDPTAATQPIDQQPSVEHGPDESEAPAPANTEVRGPDADVAARAAPARGRRRKRPTLERRLTVVLIVLLVLSLGLGAAVVAKSQADADSADRAAQQFSSEQAAVPSVVVIGDQADVGELSSAPSSQQWPSILATALGGRAVSLASSGAGYVTAGASGSTFVSEAQRVPKDASVVVFVGGAADRKVPALQIAKAATLAFSEAAGRAPEARIIAIGPLPSAQAGVASTRVLRQTLLVSAATAGITWADPIGSAWLGSSSAESSGGEQTVARRVRALIDAPAPSPTP